MNTVDEFLRKQTVKELRVLGTFCGLNKNKTNRKSYGGVVSALNKNTIDGETLLIKVCRDSDGVVWKLNEKIATYDNFRKRIKEILKEYQKLKEK